jgi:hypothetical protein
MKRRLLSALAAAAVALGIAAGLGGGGQILAGQVPIPPDTEPPGVVAKYIVRNDDGTSPLAPALAGFNNTKVGAEIYY